MERLEIDNILKLDKLNSELEYEKAISIYGKLRWMAKEDNSLIPVKQHLKILIKQYEGTHWKDETKISDEQIKDSDIAEKIITSENEFIQKRKELIREKLRENGITQKDLAKILGHRPNYMSELINGIRPFSRDDLIVIHRLFELDLNKLFPPFLKPEVTNHIKQTLNELKNSKTKIKLRLTNLETS
jgi:transcriptional regulator with XRE-family HTH domain